MYNRWSDRLASGIDARGIELPGHGRRMREPLIEDMNTLVPRLAEEMLLQVDGQYALFGHSLGALLAFELARTLRHRLGEPTRLHVSGRNAPAAPLAHAPLHDLPDQAFVDELTRIGGMPSQVLDDRDLLELFLPALRADLRLAETYVRSPAEPLGCPISVYAGRHDALVDRSGLLAWGEETCGSFDLNVVDGGHFFLENEQFLDALRVRLEAGVPA